MENVVWSEEQGCYVSDEALAYNGLVIGWPELVKLALAGRREGRERQEGLFE